MKNNNAIQSKGLSQKITLFCLPFAGGNFYAYRDFEKYTADFIHIQAIDIPGHGRRMKEPLQYDIYDIADDIFFQIKDELTRPYAIYGHSMGALLGYLVTEIIFEKELPMPQHLFLSGRYGPATPNKEKDWHLLPREEFIRKVGGEYGGIPPEVAAEKELMDMFIPIMRADFQAHSEYQYQTPQKLDVPVSVFIGANENITYEEASQWQEITTQSVSVQVFPGKHFFVFDHLPEIGNIISRKLHS